MDDSNALNSSTVRPVSRTYPPSVNALTGLCRGIVTIRVPSVITICLLWRAMRNPAFCSARTAARWLTPGIRGNFRPRFRSREPLSHR